MSAAPYLPAIDACMRAIAGDDKLTATVAAQLAGRDIVRGRSDHRALRRACHDEALHARLAPAGAKARAVFDELENARLHAIGSRRYPGVAANLSALLTAKLSAHPEDPAQGLALIARERMTGSAPPTEGEQVYEYWSERLPEAAIALFDLLPAHINDQAAYAAVVHRILAMVITGTSLAARGVHSPDEAPAHGQNALAPMARARIANGQQTRAGQDQAQGIADSKDSPAPEDQLAVTMPGEGNSGPYRVFTTRFDRSVEPRQLASQPDLIQLRSQLDKRLPATQHLIKRLANRLQRRLMAARRCQWEFDQEEGVLDPSRLARVVIDPMQGLHFKQERQAALKDTAVTLLIDNSGSMHGRPIATAALCADILTRTLEQCGVRVEILGFTTASWRGGQARASWQKAGSAPQPGRLSELLHIVYKPAGKPWRQARNNLGLMISEGLLKENLDGEALLWAHQRLAARPEQRKILMVISDGAPMDESTLLANPANYLDQHLREVIAQIESRSAVELLAIGIDHDVSRYYQRSVTISDAADLAQAMMQQFTSLFFHQDLARGRRQPRRRQTSR